MDSAESDTRWFWPPGRPWAPLDPLWHSLCFPLNPTGRGRWPPTIESGSAWGFCPLKDRFFFFFSSPLSPSVWANTWRQRETCWASVDKWIKEYSLDLLGFSSWWWRKMENKTHFFKKTNKFNGNPSDPASASASSSSWGPEASVYHGVCEIFDLLVERDKLRGSLKLCLIHLLGISTVWIWISGKSTLQLLRYELQNSRNLKTRSDKKK